MEKRLYAILNIVVFILFAALPALIGSGCGRDTEDYYNSKILTGSVTIPPAVALGKTVTADISQLDGGNGAFLFTWEYRDAGMADTDFSPITNPVVSNAGQTLTLSETDEIIAGSFIRVTVSRADRENPVTSGTAEIFDTSSFVIHGVTINTTVPAVISPGQSYSLTAVVDSSFGENHPAYSLSQEVTWHIAELQFNETHIDKNFASPASLDVDLSGEFITTTAPGTAVLRIKDSTLWAPRLTITAVSAIDPAVTSINTVELDIDWPFRQLDPFYMGDVGYFNSERVNYLPGNPTEVGYCIAPDGKPAYYFRNSKEFDWTIFRFGTFDDWDVAGRKLSFDMGTDNASMLSANSNEIYTRISHHLCPNPGNIWIQSDNIGPSTNVGQEFITYSPTQTTAAGQNMAWIEFCLRGDLSQPQDGYIFIRNVRFAGGGGGTDEEIVYVFDFADGYAVWTGQPDEFMLVQAIQGIANRGKPQVFIKNNSASEAFWFEETKKKYGFRTMNLSYQQLIARYKNYVTGYIEYPSFDGSATVNRAATLAGLLDALPVSTALVPVVQAQGVTTSHGNASSYTTSSIITTHGNILNEYMYLNHKPDFWTLRDWGIQNRALIDWYDTALPGDVYTFLKPNAVLFGWYAGEMGGVTASSQRNIITMPSDHSYNLSFHSGFFTDVIHTPKTPSDSAYTAAAGKHHVAFVYSDGDNITWLANDGARDPTRFAAAAKGTAQIPVGWSISPALPYYAPIVMDYMYTAALPTDNFVAGVSGYGYIYQGKYASMADLDAFTAQTAEAMRRSGLHYVEVIEEDKSGNEIILPIEVLNSYTAHDQIKGIIYKTGSHYVAGKGRLRWSNVKPVVAIRETLWNTSGNTLPDNNLTDNARQADVNAMADRIKGYAKNPNTIGGYTLINVHAWTHNYDSIVRMKNALASDTNVVIVTPETLMRLITENVPHTEAVP